LRGSPLSFTKPFADTLHGILDDVDKYLLEKNGVKMNGYSFVGKVELDLGMSFSESRIVLSSSTTRIILR